MISRHSASRILSALLAAGLFCALAAGRTPQPQSRKGREQKQQPQEADKLRIETELVQIDVVVVDKQGKLVRDLKREDFEIHEDGKPQPVSYFSIGTSVHPAAWLRTEPKGSGKGPEITKSTATPEASAGRYIVLAVDDFHLATGNLMQAKQALLRFVDQQLVGSDQVALITTSGSLGLYQQFTTGRTALQRAINRLSVQERAVTNSFDVPRITPYQAELIEDNDSEAFELAVQELSRKTRVPRQSAEAEVRGKARMIVAENTSFTNATLSTIEETIRSLRPLNGRKVMVLVSDGFLLGGASQGKHYDVRRITDAATRSGVVIYSIDARGLVAVIPGGDASQPGFGIESMPGARSRIESASVEAQRDGLNALAYDTGGFAVFNNNDLNLGLQKVLDDNETYYVMAYEPETVWRDGRFHKIEVRVKGRPELKVRTRKGYLARDEKAERKAAEKAEKDAEKLKTLLPEKQEKEIKEAKTAQVRTAIGSLFPLRGIPVEMSADFLDTGEPGSMAVVGARLDVSGVKFEQIGGRYCARLEIVTMIFDEKGKIAASISDQPDLKLKPETFERARQNGIRYGRTFPLKPGFYQVRLAVREEGSAQLGSAAQWVEIADLGQKKLTLSSIFLTTSAGDLKQSLASTGSTQNPENSNEQQVRQVTRRFKRGTSFNFTLFIYNAKADAKGETDLVIQPQVFSGSRLIFATPVSKVAPPDAN